MKVSPVLLKRSLLTAALLIVGISGFVVVRQSSNTKVLGNDWDNHRLMAVESANHADWDWLLRKYVDDDGRVNYASWKSNVDDRQRLKDYLERLSRIDVDPSADRASQIAFWINAHNALIIHGMLDAYPTQSIRQHANPLGYNIWTHLKLMIGGRAFSLYDMQHQLAPRFAEPRVRFALTNATSGGPRLLNRAYSAVQLENQLAANTEHFFAEPRNFRIEGTKRIHVNSMLKWFARDFGGDDAQRRQALASFIRDPSTQTLILSTETEISYIPFDWSINE